ncbi:MAG: 4Fe-4S dicluster domain-containing protein [Spartobacteria bacterium]|nr:4Fe-4S dicluster domain-containing protein [Spartobacteria bacterium]
MRRIIQSKSATPAAPPEYIPELPHEVVLTLDPAVHRCVMTALPGPGDAVTAGQVIAEGKVMRLHAPIEGMVTDAGPPSIRIQRTGANECPESHALPVPEKSAWPDFMKSAGLAGMGGGMFPYPSKMDAAIPLNIHTLVVNAVECEPGIEIDEAILMHHHDFFIRGVDAITQSLNIQRKVAGLRKSNRARLRERLEVDGFDIVVMTDTYPEGAGKLIVRKLTGRMPPTGVRNSELGYLVMNVSSLWALGRRLALGRPSMDRPLTLLAPDSPPRNIIVPVGTPAAHILKVYDIPYDRNTQVLIASGFMMGVEVDPSYAVLKGTNALFVQPLRKRLLEEEAPCILCGSCFDACPLKLHPIGMADRIKARQFSAALEIQLKTCFLCGACAAVCPANIPLAHYFREGKQWLKNVAR